MDSPRPDTTRLLEEVEQGSQTATERLFPLVYDELRRLAQSYLADERKDHTLQATALVNEAYLRLVDQTRTSWKGRAHFFAVAATVMRRILVDHARSRGSLKRGGAAPKLRLDKATTVAVDHLDTNLLMLDRALDKLAHESPVKARVVEMRFFAGLETSEIAAMLSVSERTVWRYWEYAQSWLYLEMTKD